MYIIIECIANKTLITNIFLLHYTTTTCKKSPEIY